MSGGRGRYWTWYGFPLRVVLAVWVVLAVVLVVVLS